MTTTTPDARPTEVETGSQYLRFFQVGDTGKTKLWAVRSRSSGTALALIKWHGAWRQYTLHPAERTIFNVGCLADISEFISARNAEHRTGKAT